MTNGKFKSEFEGECTIKCPYCQKEMQTGYIPNGGQPVQWIPYGEKPSVLSFLLRNREFPYVISLNR